MKIMYDYYRELGGFINKITNYLKEENTVKTQSEIATHFGIPKNAQFMDNPKLQTTIQALSVAVGMRLINYDGNQSYSVKAP